MERTAIDDVESWIGPATEKRPVSRALGAEHLAANHYELEPGETFGFGYHRHPDQEELFVVLEGTAIFETEGGDVAVSAGEAVRFAPGEWQLGRNEGEERVVALALGAPADASGTEMLRECDDCGERVQNTIEAREDGDVAVSAGEAVRFAPGEWQLGRNEGEERVVALALGAPADASGTEMLRECETCGERVQNSIEAREDGDALVTVCDECGGETGRWR